MVQPTEAQVGTVIVGVTGHSGTLGGTCQGLVRSYQVDGGDEQARTRVEKTRRHAVVFLQSLSASYIVAVWQLQIVAAESLPLLVSSDRELWSVAGLTV